MPEMAQRVAQEGVTGGPASTDVLPGYAIHMAVAANALDRWTGSVGQRTCAAPSKSPRTAPPSPSRRAPGITYNTNRVRPDEVPSNLQDLLKPQFKGRLASTPFAANFDYLASDDLWGEARTMDYLTKLADQTAGLMRCTEHERLVTGEFDALALDCSQNNALALQMKGAPIGFALAADAPLLLPLYVGVPPTPAIRTPRSSGWTISSAARHKTPLYDENASDSHLVTGSRSAERIEALQRAGVRFTVADLDYVQRQDEGEFNRRRARAQDILQKR